jgi:hypothetical protein
MAYDLADIVPLTVQTYDQTVTPPVLADAGSVSLTVTHVASSTVYTQPALAITHSGTGRYQADFSPTLPGYHKVRWVATGVTASGYSDAFHVYDATPSYLISLADARAVLRLSSTAQDEDLRVFMEGVTEVIERHLDETIVPRTFVEDYEAVQPSRWGNSLSLRHTPVLSITSIASVNGLFTWNASDFHVDKITGLVTSLPSTWGLFGDVTITYMAGRAVIPANIQQAAKIIVQHAWQTRRGAAGSPAPGGMGDTMHVSGRLGWGYAVPNAALEWLGAGMSGFA